MVIPVVLAFSITAAILVPLRSAFGAGAGVLRTISSRSGEASLACWAMRAVSSAVASRFRHSGSSTSASFAARISSIGLLKRSAKSCGPGEPFAGMPSRCAFANATSTNALQAVELMLVRRTKVYLSLESSRV